MKTILAAVLLTCTGAATLLATDSLMPQQRVSPPLNCRGNHPPTLDPLTHHAVSEDPSTAAGAIRALRARGPDGLRALLLAHAETLKRHTGAGAPLAAKSPDAGWLRLKAALDGVGRQRDCYASGLFWFTDLAQAQAAARASGKPILSLRLLGKLDEEFSCANSRFFRTTLYANAVVSRYLDHHFVLHWKSVRPVPRVTIDFGDGRKLERTLTGNSIHYVLDPEGRVMDALPGLYGPRAFLRELARAEEVTRQSASLAGELREHLLREFHQSRAALLQAQYAADLRSVVQSAAVVRGNLSVLPVVPASPPPPARSAARLAVGKGQVENPILQTASTAPDDAVWQAIAALHIDDARLDESSNALMRAKSPTASDAARRTISKVVVEDPLLRQMRSLERTIAEDTVRNEYLFHARIHEWLASDRASGQVDSLNARVYAELFLTPDSDPWLGLKPNDAYAALENDGIGWALKP